MTRIVTLLFLGAICMTTPACEQDNDEPHGGGSHYVPSDSGGGNHYVSPDSGGGNHYVPPDNAGAPPATSVTDFFVLKCCWNKSLAGTAKYVNFAGGVIGGSGFHWNIQMDSNGCGTSSNFYHLDEVTKGFWVKLTQGTAANDNWINGLPPKSCTVNGGISRVGSDAPGCGYGLYDAVNFDGTSDGCQ